MRKLLVVLCLVACGGSGDDLGADGGPSGEDVQESTVNFCSSMATAFCRACPDDYCPANTDCFGDQCSEPARIDCGRDLTGSPSGTFEADKTLVQACRSQFSTSWSCGGGLVLPPACQGLRDALN